ncbi:MAG: PA14 domain-containing protein [Planctomycetota bacterium]|nr:PA14 domain-containing protein [Planctomycetota bacterium]
MLRIVLLLLALAGGLGAAHHLLGRPDRIAAAQAEVDLRTVGDEVLRFEFDHGRLPESLDALTPGYLREDQLARDGQALYRYDPARRELEQARGAEIRGLYVKMREPLRYPLPAPASRTAAAPEPPPEAAAILETPLEVPAGPEALAPPEPPPPPEAAAALEAPLEVPAGPKALAPPEGAYVFEAEHFSETNYGWEAHPDPEASAGAYLHCKEGIANGPGQTRHDVGNFYYLHATKDFTFLRYRIHLPAAGRFYVYGRMWTTDSKCSNAICAEFDRGGPYVGGMSNRTPFRWVWTPIDNEFRNLAAGDHFLHLFIHEDGVRFDQFLLSPKPLEDQGQLFKANLATGEGTAWRAEAGPPLQLSLDLKSMVLAPDVPPACRLVLRRLRPGTGAARLRAALEAAGPGGADVVLAERGVDLAALPELAFVPLDFRALDLPGLARREYVLRARLERDGEVLAETAAPLMRPFAWEAFGPGNYLPNDAAGPLDADGSPKPGDARRWTPFLETSFEHFGVMDFGQHTTGNPRNPPLDKTIYLRTRVRVPRAGEYLFKVQADDQMLLWLDGTQIFRHDDQRPVTRAASRFALKLEAGEHRLRMRVNQTEGRWQASPAHPRRRRRGRRSRRAGRPARVGFPRGHECCAACEPDSVW